MIAGVLILVVLAVLLLGWAALERPAAPARPRIWMDPPRGRRS